MTKKRKRKAKPRMTEQQVRDDERRRIASIFDEVAGGPDTNPDYASVLRELAGALRTDREELLLVGLEVLAKEIMAEQATGNAA